jgi:hypothetical protein
VVKDDTRRGRGSTSKPFERASKHGSCKVGTSNSPGAAFGFSKVIEKAENAQPDT